MSFGSRKQLNKQENGDTKCNPVRPTHLSTKQMVGVKPEVKNGLSKFFGLKVMAPPA